MKCEVSSHTQANKKEKMLLHTANWKKDKYILELTYIIVRVTT